MAIELAPKNKQGLSLHSPLIAGSGAVGFGDAWPPGLRPELFGALVTAPLTLHPARGKAPPRLAEVPGGFLLATGDHNPGYRRVLRDNVPDWKRLGVPVIVALAGSAPADWPRLAEHLEEAGIAAGLELAVPGNATRAEASAWVNAVRHASTLPQLARVQVAEAEMLASACVEAGADALVIGTPPLAMAPAAGEVTGAGDVAWVEAPLHGPGAFPFTLRALRAVEALGLGVPLVASGGIQCAEDARRCLEMGAVAVQVRSLLWTDPAAVLALARALAS